MGHFQRNILAGLLSIIPLWLTLWVLWVILQFIIGAGGPLVRTLTDWLAPQWPALAALLGVWWFEPTLAVIVVLAGLYLIGLAATAVIGRRMLNRFELVIGRIPMVESIYGAIRKLVATLQQRPDGTQRVVLIEFPSPAMKTIGLVTRTFRDAETGQELAAVYVPTTPNPTSGYIEILPVERLIPLDWSLNEAMTFIMSGGAVAPDRITYGPTA